MKVSDHKYLEVIHNIQNHPSEVTHTKSEKIEMRNNVTKLELPLLVLFPSILYGLLIYLQLMMKVLYSTYIQPGTLKVTSVYSIKYSGLAKVT